MSDWRDYQSRLNDDDAITRRMRLRSISLDERPTPIATRRQRPIGTRATLALFVASVLLLALALAVHWKGRGHAQETAQVSVRR